MMRMRSLTVALTASALAVAVLAGGAYLIAAPGDDGRSEQVDEAAAKELVARASNRAPNALVVDGVVQTATSRAYRISGPGVDGAVDVATGQLGMLTLTDRVPSGRKVVLDKRQAAQSAAAAAKATGVGMPDVEPSVRLIDHDTIVEYEVRWLKRVNGAIVPDGLVVRINPETGEWFNLVRISRPYSTPPTATVTLDEAAAIAEASFDGEPLLEDSDLAVTFDGSGSQRLVWSLQFVDGEPGGYRVGLAATVDAMSGALLEGPSR